MAIAILHLSDVHIDSDQHVILTRAGHIAAALRSVEAPIDAVFIVVTGDIAATGKCGEYALARAFFKELVLQIRTSVPAAPVHVVVIPGNHDCNFERATDVRDPDVIRTKINTVDLNGALVRHFLAVQEDFFEFASEFDDARVLTQPERLFSQAKYEIRGRTLVFNRFNTAWLTQNPEKPSQLFVPIRLAERVRSEVAADLVITLFHHPSNWLDPDNAKQVMNVVEDSSDILLTGHEHIGDAYFRQHFEGRRVHVIHGEPLWDTREKRSAFNLVLIDLPTGKYRFTLFQWRDGAYRELRGTDWRDFVRNSRLYGRFENNQKFLDELEDIGVGFTHPRAKTLHLRDLYIYPDLQKRDFQAKVQDKTPPTIRSRDVPEFLLEHKQILVIGADRAGKTAFAAQAYVDFKAHHFVPVLLDGTQLHGDEQHLLKTYHAAFANQYSPDALDDYKQLPIEQRAVIIDNFHESSFHGKARVQVLDTLQRLFSRILILVSDLYEIEQVTERDGSTAFGPYYQCAIVPFGHLLRGKLITKWVTTGLDEAVDAGEVTRAIDSREKAISSLLGKQLLPSYPIFILGLLQAIEAGSNLNTANGSYGELFDSLITQRFALVSGRATEVGTKFVFVGRVAYYMFRSDTKTLTFDEVNRLVREYFDEFAINIDPSEILSELTEAQILHRTNGHYRFRYPYYFHFFVARYLRDNLSDPAESERIREHLRVVVDHLAFEEYASILIFFVYFSRDVETIERILANADKIYETQSPCDLDRDVDFVNKLYVEPPKPLLLPPANIEANRQNYRARLDENDAFDLPIESDSKPVEYDEALSDLVKINIGFKTLQILGQVLRNFPGVLKADLKTRIASSCYSLGLRILGFILGVAKENIEPLRGYYSQLIKEQRARPVSSAELAEQTDEFVIWVTGACGYGILKRVSRAVGAYELRETYRKVLHAGGDGLSLAIIDVSIKLDHFGAFPDAEVMSLVRRTEKNRFAFTLLRDLVADHFYLFQTEEEILGRVGRKLSISVPRRIGHEPGLVKSL